MHRLERDMKKEKIALVLFVTLISLSGCSQPPSTVQTPVQETVPVEDTKETLKTMQDQINTMQGNLENYFTSPNSTKYELIEESALNPVYYEVNNSIILQIEVKDTSSYLEISPLIVFYDENNKILSSSNAYFSYIYPNVTYATTINFLSSTETLSYDHFEVQYRGILADKKDFPENMANQVTVTSNIGANNCVIAKFINQSDYDLSYVNSYVLFYSNGELIGCTESGVYDLIHNSFGITEYSNPYDINYSEIPYDDYKLIVTSAYQNSIPYQGDAYR